MTRPPALLEHAAAGRLEAAFVGARLPGAAPHLDTPIARNAGFASGSHLVGALDVTLGIRIDGSSARIEPVLRNTSERPLSVGALVLGFRWAPPSVASLRFLRHGWQSWSVTEGRELDDAGEPAFPSGPWLRGMFHAVGAPPADRAGWHESELVTVVGTSPGGAACAAGVLERGESFGVTYLRREGDGVAIEVEQRIERALAPGASLALEPVRVALGADASHLLEEHARAHGVSAAARTRAPFQAGWCSWYHFFHDVTEDALRRNLESLAAARAEIPIDLVQLDDGYQRAIGDWLETNAKFPSGLAPLAREIRAAGFVPGLWTAPFCVAADSTLFATRPEWLLREGDGHFRGLHHGMWSKDGWIHVLDASRDDVVRHLERTFADLVAMGWTYQKLDFLYTQAMQAEAHDPGVSRAGRLRRGLEAVRRGAGADAFLLGCGCPLGPAVGVVDAMRIGPDVAPSWHVSQPVVLPGLAGTHPSTRNGVRNTLTRAWMHRRLWLNDPDCLMVRTTETKLTRDEAQSLAIAMAATGGMVIFSDDVPKLDPWSRGLVRDTIALSREVDAAIAASPPAAATARVVGLLDHAIPPAAWARTERDVLIALVNGDDEPAARAVDLRASRTPARTPVPGDAASPALGSKPPSLALGARVEAILPPHASVLLRVPATPRLAVFCDFDGTFAVQDVGSTLARRHAGERRERELERLRHGELTAWSYNLRILDRLPISEADTLAFLRTIELDPGARALIAFCEERGAPFRVLSDGFDWNLDRLQEIHGVRFEYDANRLRFEDDVWRIEATALNPACECGTGNCKRGRIERFRGEHPGMTVVHIGNGRVSDLCGALAADLAFAKGTLADALTERGAPFERFETLHDVVAALARRFDEAD
jgi:alpha-galactosidase